MNFIKKTVSLILQFGYVIFSLLGLFFLYGLGYEHGLEVAQREMEKQEAKLNRAAWWYYCKMDKISFEKNVRNSFPLGLMDTPGAEGGR